jgi:hypothetical protein
VGGNVYTNFVLHEYLNGFSIGLFGTGSFPRMEISLNAITSL